jgi:hypothetical protein
MKLQTPGLSIELSEADVEALLNRKLIKPINATTFVIETGFGFDIRWTEIKQFLRKNGRLSRKQVQSL